MKKQLIFAVLTAISFTGFAQSFNEWKDPNVNEVNRLPMHTHYFAYEDANTAARGMMEKSINYMTLNGTWKFNWVENVNQRPTDFFKTDYNDKGWDDMVVPGIWELNGYGYPVYRGAGYAWSEWYTNNPPYVPEEHNYVGSYRKSFVIPASWSGKDVILHFGSVTSNVYLWVNGKYVGYGEDSKLESEFNITPYIKLGQKNLIAFQVFRWCDGTYLEDQDFIRYSGVARDTYLYARNKKRIEDIRVTPDLDAQYKNGSLTIQLNVKGSGNVDLKLTDANGKEVASAVSKGGDAVTMNVENPKKWSAELPYLYTLTAVMQGSNEIIPIKVGFRKIELKNSQVLVNGQSVLFKGVDRHEMDPDGGYVVSKERMIQDIEIMKKFNINGIRTSHYPNDNYLYDLCDQYGIYLVAEADVESHGMGELRGTFGWGEESLAHNKSYTKAHLERNQRNVQRNYNHPSIIFWSLGNEAGYGENFDKCYDWIKAEDVTRPVQYQVAGYDGKTDIFCPMYQPLQMCYQYCDDESKVKPFIQCEYDHAMGNSSGGLWENWLVVRKYPKYQGGFIWDFVDQSPHWKGKTGKTVYAYSGDFSDMDPSAAMGGYNFCDNGLINPDRIPSPQIYEVAYVYQNIWTTPVDIENGKINIYNENFFRDLSAYYMEWTLLHNGRAVRSGRMEDLDVAPQQTKTYTIDYGTTCKHCEWLLNVSYKLKNSEGLLPAGYEVAKDQLTINTYKNQSMDLKAHVLSNHVVTAPLVADKDRNYLVVSGDNFRLMFNKKTGFIKQYQLDGTDILKEGNELKPNFWRAGTDNDFMQRNNSRYLPWKNPEMKLISMKQYERDGQVIVETAFEMPSVYSTLTIHYVINNDGAVKITQSLKTDPNVKPAPKRGMMDMIGASQQKASDEKYGYPMYRFGMQLPMPASFETVEYYGRGPAENYNDRNHGSLLGVYRQQVTDQFFSYIRPQETGTKTDIRYWKMLNKSGNGIKVIAEAPFSASALHYTIESLDEGTTNKNWHSEEILVADLTNVLIDKVQAGVGHTMELLDKYQLPYQDYEFTFIISPVKHDVE